MPKTPKQGQEGPHLPIDQVDALVPMRRDCQPSRGAFEYVGYGFEPVQDFGKKRDYQQNAPTSPRLVTKGLVEKYPPDSDDNAVTIQMGIKRS